jgi:hypothetical protein
MMLIISFSINVSSFFNFFIIQIMGRELDIFSLKSNKNVFWIDVYVLTLYN